VHAGRGGDRRPDTTPFPATPTDATIPSPPADDQHSRQWRDRNDAKRPAEYRGIVTGEAQWPISPQTAGREITVLPPPRRTPLDNRSTSRADRRVKRRAAARSLAHVSTGWEHNGGTRSPTGTRKRESTGAPSDTAGRSADLSVIFLVSYRDRLKRPHLHCRANAVLSAPGGRNICGRCTLPLRYATVLCFASVHPPVLRRPSGLMC